MTKTEIVDRIVTQSGLKKRIVSYVINNFIDQIIQGVYAGEKVEVRGFGTFVLTEKKSREIFSPILGKKIDVPAKKTILFQTSSIAEKKQTGV